MGNILERRTIIEKAEGYENNIKGLKFFIPSYQRGYRWTEVEIETLLNNLKDFNDDNGTKKYCLQPLVVTKRGDEWEVIDGQQRLTTIFIFMQFAKRISLFDLPYEIKYETRKNSDKFLTELPELIDEEEANNNIDFYYMAKAYKCMENWLKNNYTDSKTGIVKLSQKIAESVMFIWYEIEDSNKAIKIFENINSGKISLTNAELIKALFLNKENFKSIEKIEEDEIEKEQLEISNKWDIIEQALQEDSFWMFLSGKNQKYSTHIDLIFDIIAKKYNDDNKDENEKLFSFLVFYKLFNECKKDKNKIKDLIKQIWSEVEDLYSTFKFWYNDLDKYHLIGYLVHTESKNIGDIAKLSLSLDKDELQAKLKGFVKTSLNEINIDEIEYKKFSKEINKILLLHNIQTLIINKSQNRFPFDLYEKQDWNLEHIHALNTEFPEGEEEAKIFLDELKAYYESDAEEIEKIKNTNPFNIKLAKNFYKICQEREKYEINDISNMALLDKETNGSIGNSFFSEKRKEIIKKDKGNVFIPTCTKNVFLKMYTEEPGNMGIWDSVDRDAYKNDIRNTLKEYLSEEAANNE